MISRRTDIGSLRDLIRAADDANMALAMVEFNEKKLAEGVDPPLLSFSENGEHIMIDRDLAAQALAKERAAAQAEQDRVMGLVSAARKAIGADE